LYVFGHLGEKDGQEQRFIDQLTLQQASGNRFPPGFELLVGGHVHLFQALSFGPGRPPQLVAGNGGTLLDPPVTTPLTGLEMAGQPVTDGTMLDQFGFVAMQRAPGGWTLAVKGPDGAVLENCKLAGGELLCGAAARARQASERSRLLSGGAGLLLAFLVVVVLVVLLRRSVAGAPPSGGATGG
jgi:hypothetical protein